MERKEFREIRALSSYLIPLAGVCYFVGAYFFELPYAFELLGFAVIAVLMINVFLGLIETENAFDGSIVLDTRDEERDIFRIEVDCVVEEIKNKSVLRLAVRQEDGSQD
jgi:hypothetical protein